MKPRARKPEPAYVQALNGGDWCGLENQMHTGSARRDPELAILSTASSFDLCAKERSSRLVVTASCVMESVGDACGQHTKSCPLPQRLLMSDRRKHAS
jgi:hypothetical protein